MKYTAVSRAIALLGMGWIGVGGASAQEAAVPVEAAEARLSTVQVTAKGYAADALDTPAATVTLDRSELQRRGAVLPGDVLRGEPGLAVAGDSAQGQNPVIRGLKKESVVLLVDGMRLNSAQPAGAVASFMSLPLAERLEVVKGPASVLYGTGALGGAVQVLLPQARFVPGLSVTGTLGGETGNGALQGAGVLQFSEGDHALMLGASAARVGDYEGADGPVARTGYDSQSLIGQYRWRLDGRQQLRVSLQRHLDENVWYPGSTRPLANAALGTSTVHSPSQQRRLGELGWSWTGDASLPLRADVRLYRQEMQRLIWSWADKLARDVGRTDVTFATNGIDAKADWTVNAQHLLSFGLNAWRMGGDPERWLASPTPTSALVRNDPFDQARIRSVGVYVQDDMRFGALGVLAGLRVDRVSGDAASMGNGSVTSGLSRSDTAPSAGLGLTYTVSPLWRPYANLSRAFRAGEMRERYESSPRGDGYYYVGNPQIEPEKATQVELGVKGGDARLTWSAAVYRNRISDYITGRPTGAVQSGLPVKATVNLGHVVIRGLEAQARWQAWAGQWLHAGLSVLRGDHKDLDEPLFQMPADELRVGWDGRVGGGWTLDATLRLVRRQDRVATQFSLGSENATAGFATADVGASWAFAKDQQLRLRVRNLADKAYHEHLTEGLSGQEIQAPGRSLSLAWAGKF